MVNRNTGIPLYVQLAQQLEQDIQNKIYADGQRLPSETQLCQKYGVSRITVRQAIFVLQQKKLLYSVHGKGTYVHYKHISQQLSAITTFEKTLMEKGLKGHTTVKNYTKSRIPASIKQFFDTDNVHRLDLVGHANGLPMVYYTCYLKGYVAERMYPLAKQWEAENHAFSTWDMYKELEMRYLHVEQKFTADIADNRITNMLGLAKGDPVIKMETYIYEKNILVEYKIAVYRADKYSFTIVREVDNG